MFLSSLKNYVGIFTAIIVTILLYMMFYVFYMEPKQTKEAYNKGNYIICSKNDNGDKVIILKKDGWMLKGKYFIKNSQAINIYRCNAAK